MGAWDKMFLHSSRDGVGQPKAHTKDYSAVLQFWGSGIDEFFPVVWVVENFVFHKVPINLSGQVIKLFRIKTPRKKSLLVLNMMFRAFVPTFLWRKKRQDNQVFSDTINFFRYLQQNSLLKTKLHRCLQQLSNIVKSCPAGLIKRAKKSDQISLEISSQWHQSCGATLPQGEPQWHQTKEAWKAAFKTHTPNKRDHGPLQ